MTIEPRETIEPRKTIEPRSAHKQAADASRLLNYIRLDRPIFLMRDVGEKEQEHFWVSPQGALARTPLKSLDTPTEEVQSLLAKFFQEDYGVQPRIGEPLERLTCKTAYIDIHFTKEELDRIEQVNMSESHPEAIEMVAEILTVPYKKLLGTEKVSDGRISLYHHNVPTEGGTTTNRAPLEKESPALLNVSSTLTRILKAAESMQQQSRNGSSARAESA